MTVTEAPPTIGLTPEDIQAIRNADTVVFRGYRDVFTIEVSIRGRSEPAIFTAKQQRLYPVTDRGMGDERHRIITVTGAISGYENTDGDSWGQRWRGDEHSAAFTMIHSAKYDHAWLTWTTLIRAGDHVQLSFEGDRHSNGNTKAQGLHADALHLVIKREQTKPPMVFPIDFAVSRDNSARMVRRYG